MLADLLRRNRAAIHELWVRQIIETYPPDTARLLRREQDRFQNPVGYTLAHECEVILEGLARGAAQEGVGQALDAIVRLRAVQDFSAAQAVGFVYFLKTALREFLAAHKGETLSHEEWLTFDATVDGLALLAFDLYSQRRERIFAIRTKEIKGRADRVLARLDRIYGDAGQHDPDLDEPETGSSNNKRGSGQ